MKRGFKTRCEDMAASARNELKLGALDKLCPFAYANYLNIPVQSPEQLPLAEQHLRQLVEIDPDSWSGLTMRVGKSLMIVVNSAHPRVRQVSTLMHELAHFKLAHLPARLDVSPNGLLLLSDYDVEQEDEADWLGATLLLPRNVLLSCRRRGWSAIKIAEAYGVSEELCIWRLRMTAVDHQLSSSHRSR